MGCNKRNALRRTTEFGEESIAPDARWRLSSSPHRIALPRISLLELEELKPRRELATHRLVGLAFVYEPDGNTLQ